MLIHRVWSGGGESFHRRSCSTKAPPASAESMGSNISDAPNTVQPPAINVGNGMLRQADLHCTTTPMFAVCVILPEVAVTVTV
jgi:hypothetical protein